MTVIGRDVPPNLATPSGVTVLSASGGSGLQVRPGARRPPVRPSGTLSRKARWALLPHHRAIVFSNWARAAARAARPLPFDVVHAHDFTALEVGAALARQRAVPLVYDAHEWWSERRQEGRPTPLRRRRELVLEARLGKQAAAVLTVGEGVANQLRQQFGWRHVEVVRNTFAAPPEPPKSMQSPSAAMYAGRLAGGRDLETVAAASRRTELRIRLIGPPDPQWIVGFDPGEASVEDAVDLNRVDEELQRAGLALVTLADGWGNHQIALPGKLFRAVQVGVPVVASDLGELGRTVRDNRLGVLYQPGDAESLSAALSAAVSRYPELVRDVRRAREAMSWTIDRATLLRVYDRLSDRGRVGR